MAEREFVPNSKYQIKMLLMITLLAFLILLGVGILAALISLDDPGKGLGLMGITIVGVALFWLVGMILSVPYFRSLRYEVLEDEVIVHVGILTHSVKHVPYRTVTNITVRRDIFDRWFFNLGSLYIQTAGMSGQSGAEEKLVGMENVQEVYEMWALSCAASGVPCPPPLYRVNRSPKVLGRCSRRCRPSASCWRRGVIDLLRSKSRSSSTQSDSTSCPYPGILFFRLLARWGRLNVRLNHELSVVEVAVQHLHFPI